MRILAVAFLDFHQNWHRRKTPKSKNEFVWGQQYTAPPLSLFCPKTSIFGQEVLKFMQILITLYQP